jgi:HSP20 family protein
MATSTRMQRRTPSPFGLFPLLTRDIDLLQANMRRILQNQPATGENTGTMSQALAWTPAVEISETPDELVITAELPGIDADEVHVVIDGDMLTIRGEKRSVRREGDDDTQFYLVERSYGSFQRSFTLPSTVDPESIVAEFNNGVLTVHLQKVDAERTRGREIPISARADGGSQERTTSGQGRQSLDAGGQGRESNTQNRETASASQSRSTSSGAQNRDANAASQSRAASAGSSSGATTGSGSGSTSGSSGGSGTSGRGGNS